MTEQRFNPDVYLTDVNGQKYLKVQHRILWFRSENPNGHIETEMLHFSVDPPNAIFKATVVTDQGVPATGHGSETMSDFRDFLEKAETKAIGRALAALGYGTQFCPSLRKDPTIPVMGDDTMDSHGIVDAPASPARPRVNGVDPKRKSLASQIKAFVADNKIDHEWVTDLAMRIIGKPVANQNVDELARFKSTLEAAWSTHNTEHHAGVGGVQAEMSIAEKIENGVDFEDVPF